VAPTAPRQGQVVAFSGLIAAAALLGYVLALPLQVERSFSRLLLAAVLALGFAVAESLVLHVEIGDHAHSASLAELPLVLGLFWLDPLTVLAARLLAGAVVLVVVRRQSAVKVLFNLSVFALEVVAALLVFRVLLPGSSSTGGHLLLAWAAAATACVVSSLVSALCVLRVIELSGAPRPDRDLGVLRLTTAMAAVNATLGVVGVHALAHDWHAAAPLLLLALTFGLAYRGHVRLRARHERLATLYGFVRQVSTGSEVDGTVHAVLAQTLDLLKGEVAVLTQVLDPGPDAERTGPRLLTHSLHLDGQVRTRRQEAELTDWPVARCLSSGQPLLGVRGARDEAIAEYLSKQGVRDCVLVAVPGPDGPVGALFVGSRRSQYATFEPADVLALEGVASHAAVALQNRRLVDRLTYESRHDVLTDLPNRTEFQAQLRVELAREHCCVSVLFMDLDRFKDVNDTLGHHAGDRLLCQVAERLSASVEPGCTVARLGGDEFAVVLPAHDTAMALEVAGRLRRVLERPVGIEGLSVDVGVSIGVASSPEHGGDASLLMRRADVAMYDAKSRSGIAAYDPERDESSTSRLALVAQLRDGLAKGQFTLDYQPQVVTASGVPVRFEALLRWRHPQRGLVPPDAFIPVAERAGLLQDITSWVISTALDAVVAWRAAGHELGVAVNLSPRNLLDPALGSTVRRELASRGLPAEVLTLEITESTIMAEPARAVETLRQLRGTGVRLSIDDFGTGYSSLSYLKRLPVDEVKIDRAFVRGLADDPADVAIVRAVLTLAESLHLDVVAEGVEDEASRRLLDELGCDLLQGYHLSRPMPGAAVLPWLAGREGAAEAAEAARARPDTAAVLPLTRRASG